MQMELDETAELLGRVPIFKGLTPPQLNAIARRGVDVFFHSGDAILEAGQRGDTAYLILAGFVGPEAEYEAWFGDELLGQGTFLGELGMLIETTFTVTVLARWNVCALALRRETMYALMERDPGIAHHFAGKLLERLQTLASDMRRAEGEFAIIENSLDAAIDLVS
jgi:CRP/FNR family transcriptional regulator, cyclic AMP receptor protein